MKPTSAAVYTRNSGAGSARPALAATNTVPASFNSGSICTNMYDAVAPAPKESTARGVRAR